jgi:two-component system response regulator NreC
MIKILLADDHQMMRKGLASLIKEQTDIQVIAEAENGRMAVQMAERLHPDVVVMDVTMPDLNGIDATRQIVSRAPNAKVVALSMHSDKQFVVEMFRAGACGYLLKDSAIEELAEVIRTVVRGKTYISPKINGLILSDYFTGSVSPGLASPRLSEREREVLQLLAEGKGTKEIAADLHLSAKTIETHRQHVMEKLEIYTIAELTKYAIREGLTSLEH